MVNEDEKSPDCDKGSLEAAEAHLKKAEAELEHAELEHAEGDVEEALAEIKEAAHCHHEFEVTVLYDGVKKKFEVRPGELVKKLLDQAIKEFGPLLNPHTLSLFTEAGEELKDEQTIKDAGIKPHELLLLRPSKVKGGSR